MSPLPIGFKHSIETKRKMSIAHKGFKHSNETKRKISEGHKGKSASLHVKEVASKIHKGKKLSESHREALIKANTGRTLSEEHKAAISKHNKGRKFSAERIDNMRKVTIDRHQRNPDGHPNRLCAKIRKTSIEQMVEECLLIRNIPYVFNERVGKYFPDFILVDRKVIIECDEEYWHKEIDSIREDFLRNQGYDVFHLTSKQIKENLDFEMDDILKGEK